MLTQKILRGKCPFKLNSLLSLQCLVPKSKVQRIQLHKFNFFNNGDFAQHFSPNRIIYFTLSLRLFA